MRQMWVVYDDSVSPNEFIREIVGGKTFGMLRKNQATLEEQMEAFVQENSETAKWHRLDSAGKDTLLANVQAWDDSVCVCHLLSHFVVHDAQQAALLLAKMPYVHTPVVFGKQGRVAGFLFGSRGDYEAFLKKANPTRLQNDGFDALETDAFGDISIPANFIRFWTGSFDTRYFNEIDSDEYQVIKKSEDKRKIRAEYTFYSLLPDDMKRWFVMPYGYEETPTYASYITERYHIADMAIRWVHGAFTESDLKALLDHIFQYIGTRATRPASKDERRKQADALYLHKVEQRTQELKKHPEYPKLAGLLAQGSSYGLVDTLIERYTQCYHRATSHLPGYSAVSHGDLCFSNILYHSGANILRFIDPKGALQEEDLWMDPYYDLAKLSHSICGYYDFFNQGMYRILLDKQMNFRLEIGFDAGAYIPIFKNYCTDNGFDFSLVRLYEASLFLSMPVLHMDDPHKVLGFLLNAARILDEVDI